MRCKCGCEETSTDPSGCVYCKNCGEIIEENFFSNSEVTFAKESDGSSTRIGRFIGYGGNRGSNPNAMTCSREFTINRGRSRIATLGSLLRIENTYIEEAQRLFKLAVYNAEDPNSSGFIKGRKTDYVAAACLYLECRLNEKPYMLVDFAEAIHGNVYTLGGIFIKLYRYTQIYQNVKIPFVDPSLYTLRFASQLGFGDRETTRKVAATANKIIQQMGRDWINIGRRPSGICGAGLLIAARLHGYKVTPNEIVQVVRVCDATLKRRLNEFADTKVAASLSFDEFDLDKEKAWEESNPPAFTRARVKEEIEKAHLELWERHKTGESIESLLDEEKRRVKKIKLDIASQALTAEEKSEELERFKTNLEKKHYKKVKGSSAEDFESILEGGDITSSSAAALGKYGDDDNDYELTNDEVEKEIREALRNSEFLQIERTAKRVLDAKSREIGDIIPGEANKSDDEPNSSKEKETWNTKSDNEDEDDENDPGESLDDVPDADVDIYLHTPEQVKLKEKAWNEMYKDYLKEKEEKEQENELNGKTGPKRKYHKKGSKRQSDNAVDASSQALKNLAPSKKINREILGALFNMDEQALEKGPQSSTELTSALDIHDGDFASSFYADELIGDTAPTSSAQAPSRALLGKGVGTEKRKQQTDIEDDDEEDDDDNDDDIDDDDDGYGGGNDYYGRNGSRNGGYDDDDGDNGRNDDYGDEDENYF